MVRELYAETPPNPHLETKIRGRLAQQSGNRRGRIRGSLWPALLIGGAATVAAATAAVVALGGLPVLGGDDGGTGPAGRPAVAPETIDARGFLLTSAEKAERAPATSGRYWYTRVRTTEPAGPVAGKEGRKPRRAVAKSPFAANVSHSQESWTARERNDRTRTIVGIDRKYDFSVPADEAKWKAMGSPQLGWVPAEPKVNNYDMPIRFTIGQKQLTMRALAELPTDADELGTEMRRRYNADVNDPKYPLQGGYLQYVWSTAQDLLAGPITPGTKAALYRLLAQQKGIELVGKVTDSLGRPGVSLAMDVGMEKPRIRGGRPFEARLIIDPKSAELLAYEAHAVDDRGRREVQLSMAYQSMGWVNSLGARP
ncbi:hypothetical protein GCM10009780_64200 [Actinomadura alba]